MVKLAIVQGRLSAPIGSRYQHFPIHAWRQEFDVASRLNFDGIEWVVSDFSNPLFDKVALDEAARLSLHHQVKITSISLDVLMYQPLRNLSEDDIDWLFEGICAAIELLGTPRVSIPIEEKSGIRSKEDVENILLKLTGIINRFGDRVPLLSVETDLSPNNIKRLLEEQMPSKLGILVDTGNLTACGFALDDYIDQLGKRIYGIHIKDRSTFFGPNCRLGNGDAEIKACLNRLAEMPNLSDITLQSFRSNEDYVEDARAGIEYIKRMLEQSLPHNN